MLSYNVSIRLRLLRFTNLLKESHFVVTHSAVEVGQGTLAINSDSFSEVFDGKTESFDVVLQGAPTNFATAINTLQLVFFSIQLKTSDV